MRSQEYELLKAEWEERLEECKSIANQYPWLADEIGNVMEYAYRRGYSSSVLHSGEEEEDWALQNEAHRQDLLKATHFPSLEISKIVQESMSLKGND